MSRVEPRLGRDDAVECVEEPHIVGDRRVEQCVVRVDVRGLRWVGRSRKWIHPNAFPICDCVGDVGVGGAAIVRPQQRIGLIRGRRHRDVSLGDIALMVGRQDEVPAARALVDARYSDVFDRGLPAVVDRADDRAGIGGRDLHHHRTDVCGVEERHEVDGVGVGREGLVLPADRPRPEHDLVGRSTQLDHLTSHQLEVDRGHTPDHRLDGAAVHGPVGDLGRVRRRTRCRFRSLPQLSHDAPPRSGCRHSTAGQVSSRPFVGPSL